ncbi:MAG: NAD(P)/FAD-dependent oxidoreductase, partial [Pseudomonadota bacterium]
MSNNYAHILQPGMIGKMNLKNRIIFSPCETLYATVDGEVTQKVIDYYARRAKGGTALLVVHSAQACTKLDPIDPFAHSLRVDDNAYIPMLAELTEAVHRAGAKIAILVSAGGGAAAMGFPYDRGLEGVIEMQNLGVGDRVSLVARRPVKVLSTDEVKKFIKVYGLAARRVMLAGFDAMYIHALAYLTSQFMSPLWNNRDDEYGKDRLRFLLELIDECRKNASPDFPLVVRMAIDEYFPGAITVEEGVKLAKRLGDAGVSAIDCMAGIYESMHYIVPPVYLPKGILVNLAEAVKKEVKIPVITQGRIYDPDMANDIIRDGKADFIQMARGLLADPEWVNKVQDGRENEIRKCIGCNRCFDRVLKAQSIRCAINPTVGREGEFEEVPPLTPTSKKVVVVGAGPAGMEAARISAEKGHRVTLFEKTGELGGGQLKLATVPPCKDEYLNIVRYYQSQFDRLKNISVTLNKEVTIEDIKREVPDVVILATGATPLVPTIEGIDRENVVTINDVLGGKVKVSGKVVVAGGGSAGIDCANFLSAQEIDVTVVEMLDECALDEELITRLTLLFMLGQKKNVKIMTGLTIQKITKEGLVAKDKENKEVTIPADYVVTALGVIPYNPLEKEVRE